MSSCGRNPASLSDLTLPTTQIELGHESQVARRIDRIVGFTAVKSVAQIVPRIAAVSPGKNIISRIHISRNTRASSLSGSATRTRLARSRDPGQSLWSSASSASSRSLSIRRCTRSESIVPGIISEVRSARYLYRALKTIGGGFEPAPLPAEHETFVVTDIGTD